MYWKGLLTRRKGQNTVEYLLMLSVVVGVVLISGVAMKRFMPNIFDKVSILILGAVNQLGAS
ncbi:MAG: hypothetical protein HY926_05440 [Elusimicrobia bacterium]|nr:hypothetical protein [Elusimicrobiota bacterium]